MSRFCGHKTGFNPTGENECTPNFMGPPDTKFSGRGALPDGRLKRYPGAAADISGGNRRLAKSNHGDGGGDGVRYAGSPNGFKGGSRK